MIFAMRKPHKVNSICGAPFCEQCGEPGAPAKVKMTDHNAVRIEPVPLFIVREATEEEYLAQPGPKGSYGKYFYEVSTD